MATRVSAQTRARTGFRNIAQTCLEVHCSIRTELRARQMETLCHYEFTAIFDAGSNCAIRLDLADCPTWLCG